MWPFLLSVLLHVLVGTVIVRAQNAAPPPDLTLDAAARAEVIDGALRALNDAYVFPEMAKKMEEAIRARQQRTEYDAITSGRQFAQILTGHLREVNKDVYILTSSRTFSGAEEFTYNLKHLKRATVVGETTGGGAHTVAGRRITSQFAIAVPSGRPINAVTTSNWEGVGVEPDVKVSAESALKAAHLIALEKQQPMPATETPSFRNEVTTTIQSLRIELGALAPSIAIAESVTPVPASKAGEDFESGTLANWRVDQRGAGGWFAYSNGKTPPDRSRSDPNFPFDVPDPPQGKFAAVTDMNGPGRRILYRDITLDGRYRLHLSVFYVNFGTFSAAATSSRSTISDEQQYRIDIVSASAPLDSMATEHVFAAVFQGQPGDPSRRPPTEVTFDLSPWAGQTVRLRIASADNQAPLRTGIDNIRFERLQR